MRVIKLLVVISFISVGSVLGVLILPEILKDFNVTHPSILENGYIAAGIGIAVLFLVLGWTIPKLVLSIKDLEQIVFSYSALEIMFATIGLLMGLLISVMISFIIGLLSNGLLSKIIPIILTLLLGYLGFQFGLKKRDELLMFLPENMARSVSKSARNAVPKLLDTSAIIDGRILNILKIGFIDGELLIPQGVINELQVVADSTDSIKRDKGRRGLEILNEIHKTPHPSRIIHPQKGYGEIDELLVKLAQQYHAHVITTDYNLNKVCDIHGVKVLNVNELSNTVRSTMRQGEQFELLITKVGKEPGQGVGYFDDGTMVVVDHARNDINKLLSLEVVSVLQNTAGRIIFAKKVEQ